MLDTIKLFFPIGTPYLTIIASNVSDHTNCKRYSCSILEKNFELHLSNPLKSMWSHLLRTKTSLHYGVKFNAYRFWSNYKQNISSPAKLHTCTAQQNILFVRGGMD